MAAWLCLAGPAGAAGEAGGPLQGDARARALRALQAAQQDVTTVRARVLQRKRHPLLKEEAVREGALLLERPGRLRWDVQGPGPVTLVADGATLLVYRPEQRQVERRDLSQDLTGRATLGVLVAALRFDLAELEKRFDVAVHREGKDLRLRLTPRARWLARAVASIDIVQHDAEPVPHRFLVAGGTGDRTETVLRDIEVNARLPEGAFTLRLGPEVTVVDARRAPDAGGSDR
jgi:outer membrane lipoprotein-sorting protein